jgi:hypothetical protein
MSPPLGVIVTGWYCDGDACPFGLTAYGVANRLSTPA